MRDKPVPSREQEFLQIRIALPPPFHGPLLRSLKAESSGKQSLGVKTPTRKTLFWPSACCYTNNESITAQVEVWSLDRLISCLLVLAQPRTGLCLLPCVIDHEDQLAPLGHGPFSETNREVNPHLSLEEAWLG